MSENDTNPGIYAEIELNGQRAVLTEDGWQSDSPALAAQLEDLRGVVHPDEKEFYPTPAWRLADRARLVYGAKIIRLPNTPHEDDRVY